MYIGGLYGIFIKIGKTVVTREPYIDDAARIISVMIAADMETLILARNPGEFCTTVENEEKIIDSVLKNPNCTRFVAEYGGK